MTALALAVGLAGLSGAQHAAAQLPSAGPVPRAFPSYDPNGVDLSSGTIRFQGLSIAIGPPEGGLSWSLDHTDYSSSDSTSPVYVRDNLNSFVQSALRFPDLPPSPNAPREYTVVSGSRSSMFRTFSGAIVGSGASRGKSLTKSGNVFTFTDVDGTVSSFDATKRSAGIGTGGLATSVVRPTGERLDYYYVDGGDPNCPGCLSLRSVTSNLGYMARYSGGAAPTVQLINLSVDYCDPLAASCATSLTWPRIVTTSSSETDLLGRQQTFGLNGVGSRTPPGVSAISATQGLSGQALRTTSVSQGGRTWLYDFTEERTADDILSAVAVTVTDPFAKTSATYSEGLRGNMVWHTDELGRKTQFTSGGEGELASITYPEANREDYQYAAVGVVNNASRTSKAGDQTTAVTATYPASCTDPGVNAKTCHKPITVTDARGGVTDYTYDLDSGQVTSVTGPAGANGVRPQTRYAYAPLYAKVKDASGALVNAATPVYKLMSTSTCKTGAAPACVGTADETRTTYAYASSNLWPTSVTVAAGDGSISATTTTAYDAVGNVTSVDGPLPGAADTTVYRYDVLRRKVGEIGPAFVNDQNQTRNRAVRTTYHLNGQVQMVEQGVTSGQDDTAWTGFQMLQRTINEYDGLGRLVRVNQQNAVGATLAVTQYGYDALDRRICSTVRMNPAVFASLPADACVLGTTGADGPDRITRTEYDAAGQQTQLTTGYGAASARVEKTATYTANGKIQTLADGKANLTTYEYDGFDRLAKTRYPNASGGGSSTTDFDAYGYDANDNRTSWRRRSGETTAFTYDALNRAQNGVRGEAYGYDNLGHQVSATYSGQSASAGFDALGRVTSETTNGLTMAYQYDQAGNRTRLSWPDGFYISYEYDAASRLKLFREWSLGWLAQYAYDDLGRLSRVLRGNGVTSSYGYDGLSRANSLTLDLAGTASDQSWSQAYSPASQVLSRVSGNGLYDWSATPGAKTYQVNGLNQLTQAAGVAVGYDPRGNLNSDGTRTYGYDLSNNLTTASGGTSLAYEPAGRLWQVTAGGTTTSFLYAGSDLVGEYANGQLVHRYVPGGGTDAPTVWYEGATTSARRYLAQDFQGSVVSVTGDAATPLATNTYDEYGVPAAGNLGRFQYTGQIWLPQLGLYHYKARAYSPSLGRFMQTDPVGYGDGINWYAYVGNDPVNRIDPTGMINEGCGTPGHPECPSSPDVENGNLAEIVVTAPECGNVCQWERMKQENLKLELEQNRKDFKVLCDAIGLLGDTGRLRLGADAAGGTGSFGKAGLGVSLRGDGSLEFDGYLGFGFGGGVLVGAGIGVDNAGSTQRGGWSGGHEIVGGIGVPLYGALGLGLGGSVPIKPTGSNGGWAAGRPQGSVGVGLGPRFGAAAGVSGTATWTARSQGFCK